MTISVKLAHKLQNFIQLIMSYIDLGKEDQARKELRAMSHLIDKNVDEEQEDR